MWQQIRAFSSITDKCLLHHHSKWKATNMGLSIKTLLILGVILTTFLVFRPGTKLTVQGNPVQSNLPVVDVDPSEITAPELTPSENVTISVRISNVTDLKGFDIRLGWNSSILNYTSHLVKIPVETYPDGVLHEPELQIKNEVNATAGTYLIAFVTLGPSFNGSGIVFEMTFTVASFGKCALDIYNSTLSDSGAQPIDHSVRDGYFSNAFYDVAILSLVPSSTSIFIGETANITVVVLNNGTTRNENFNVTTYHDGVVVDTETVFALPPHTEETLIFHWNTSGLPPGDYTISANATIVEDETRVENNGFEDGTVTLISEVIHDVAVTALVPFKTLVFRGFCFQVNVTVENQGNSPEAFNVTLYANSNAINTTEIYLDGNESVTVIFAWETTDAVEYESYVLNATADVVHGENDTADNSITFGDVEVAHAGDFDADMDVDIFDIVFIAQAYGSGEGDSRYDPIFDVDCDGDVDIFDIVMITPYYGYERP